jgi:hypothetical protein
MKKTTRNMAIAAVMTAFTVVFLYIAALLPMEQIGIIALSSLFGIAAVIEGGISADILVFIGSSIIGALIVPNKPMIHFYVLFFGYYPIVKSLAEKLRNNILKWAVKLAVFNLALTALWFFASFLILNPTILQMGTGLIYLLGNLVFVVYDIGLSRLISFYIVRISKHVKKSDG